MSCPMPGPAQWFYPGCPRHSTYEEWKNLGAFFCKLNSSIAKTGVKEHPVMSLVLDWAEEKYKLHKERSLSAPCICEEPVTDGEDGTLIMGASWASEGATDVANLEDVNEHLVFFLPSRET